MTVDETALAAAREIMVLSITRQGADMNAIAAIISAAYAPRLLAAEQMTEALRELIEWSLELHNDHHLPIHDCGICNARTALAAYQSSKEKK